MTQTPEVSVEPTREIERVSRFLSLMWPNLSLSMQRTNNDEYWAVTHILARLASQTPPATQPSATVGEVTENADDGYLSPALRQEIWVAVHSATVDGTAADVTEATARICDEVLKFFAALPTPASVATATPCPWCDNREHWSGRVNMCPSRAARMATQAINTLPEPGEGWQAYALRLHKQLSDEAERVA